MSLIVTIKKCTNLKKGREELDPCVTASFSGESLGQTSIKRHTLHPVWNEQLVLEDAPSSGVLELNVVNNSGRAGSAKVISTAVLNISKQSDTVELKLRAKPSKSKKAQATANPNADVGVLHISFSYELSETLFKKKLIRLRNISPVIIGPLVEAEEILAWKRPYKTAFFLLCLNWVLFNFSFVFAVPFLIMGLTLIHTFRCRARYGPGYNFFVEKLQNIYLEQDEVAPEGVTATMQFETYFTSKRLQKLTAKEKQKKDDLLHAYYQEKLAKINGALDVIWAILARKDARRSNLIVNVLLCWIFCELFGVFPPLEVTLLFLVWAAFVLYPLHKNFPKIVQEYNVLSFLFDDEKGYAEEDSEARIRYENKVQSPTKERSRSVFETVLSPLGKSSNGNGNGHANGANGQSNGKGGGAAGTRTTLEIPCNEVLALNDNSHDLRTAYKKDGENGGRSLSIFGNGNGNGNDASVERIRRSRPKVLEEEKETAVEDWSITKVAIPQYEERGEVTYFKLQVWVDDPRSMCLFFLSKRKPNGVGTLQRAQRKNDSGNATSFFHNVLFFPTKYHAQRNTRFSHSASVCLFVFLKRHLFSKKKKIMLWLILPTIFFLKLYS